MARDAILKLRVTAEELELWRALAREEGLGLSAYVRQRLGAPSRRNGQPRSRDIDVTRLETVERLTSIFRESLVRHCRDAETGRALCGFTPPAHLWVTTDRDATCRRCVEQLTRLALR